MKSECVKWVVNLRQNVTHCPLYLGFSDIFSVTYSFAYISLQQYLFVGHYNVSQVFASFK